MIGRRIAASKGAIAVRMAALRHSAATEWVCDLLFHYEDCPVKRMSLLFLAAAFSIAQVDVPAAEEDEGLRYAHSSWSKYCWMAHFKSCFTRIDAFSACGIVTVLIVQHPPYKTQLAIMLPPGARRDQNIDLTIDGQPSFAAPIVNCPGPVCSASLDADDALIARMKAGQSLAVQWLVSSNSPVRHTFPLAGFADAHDGPELPMTEMKEKTTAQMNEIKMRREQAAEERRKRGGC
jgi:invasion protein IalB